MEPDAFTASLLKWGPAPAPAMRQQWEQLGGLEELFSLYGIRYYTAAKIAELGFTARTLVNMTDQELDDMMTSLSHLFRWDLLVGERYGIKAAVRAERRRLHESDHDHDHSPLLRRHTNFDALSQEGFSEEAVVQQQIEKETAISGGGGGAAAAEKRKKHRRRSSKKDDDDEDDDAEDDDVLLANNNNNNNANKQIIMTSERQREHPFIVTEPGEVARGKKNGLDYLFHLYDQCRDFLIQVQNIAKERGDKCPTKVTNEVFRYAKRAGASHINKPKMRHYVHCYALHCLDEEASNALRRAYKDRGENVGAWRLACYAPLVSIAARQAAWDIDSIFNSHPLLSVWYVPTKLRHLCHAHRSAAAASTSTSLPPPPPPHLSF